jgi:CubicO group peptidase (beta-lactamase class C family)
MRSIAAALCVLLVAAVARAGTPAECGAPAAMSDEWQVSPPAQQGLDPELICATGPGLAKRTDAAPHGVVVARNGVLVYERYFAAAEMYGYAVPYNANTLHDIASITTGVVALLIGIAFDRGWLSDLDAPIMSIFPEYADLRTPEKDRITLRHLLAMTSGGLARASHFPR